MSTVRIAAPGAAAFDHTGMRRATDVGQRAGQTSPNISVLAIVVLSAACWAGILGIVSLI